MYRHRAPRQSCSYDLGNGCRKRNCEVRQRHQVPHEIWGSAVEGPAASSCPSDLRALNKGYRPTLVIPRACDFIDLSREVLDLKQNRHPERSASQIYRLTEGSGAESKDPGDPYLAHAARSFSTTETRGHDPLQLRI